MVEISSTLIRQACQNNLDARNLLASATPLQQDIARFFIERCQSGITNGSGYPIPLHEPQRTDTIRAAGALSIINETKSWWGPSQLFVHYGRY